MFKYSKLVLSVAICHFKCIIKQEMYYWECSGHLIMPFLFPIKQFMDTMYLFPNKSVAIIQHLSGKMIIISPHFGDL